MTDLKTITMTSVEIAAMTGKQHGHILRDVDRAIQAIQSSRLKADAAQGTHSKSGECSINTQFGATEATYTDGRNAERRMLILNKQMVFTIITGCPQNHSQPTETTDPGDHHHDPPHHHRTTPHPGR
ncbi:Rha family transcriptional regulator [Pseudomonas sp. MF6751]|uniref:Rha family transcriptional regulator n=1 Tax=Pseudomonas sp. MF6751 TaxID=2797528 RepID=UPI00190B778D|nr:Rha family transcriptional regulator [Pseudomonas sp. MF6751]MBK3477450.1 Rha family transcriptional regulator [Pseudomonas sp. MF6751]